MSGNIETVDGNTAAAQVAHATSEVIAIYPITPSSPMGEVADEMSVRGETNIWDTIPEVSQMQSEGGKVVFASNNAGGVTGGLATGQPIVVRLAVKPTPTIDKPQHTIDKYTLENKQLAAITRRDPTIVARIWPVAENYTAMVILDHLLAHHGYQLLKEK